MNVLGTDPIAVKAATSGTVYVIGDIISQLLGDKHLGELDRTRILRSGAAGFMLHGPLSHFWYIISDYGFNNILNLQEWWSVFPKIGVDQLFWGPTWNAIYIMTIGVLQRDKLKDSLSAVKSQTVPLMKSGIKLWVPTHMITYGLIPQANRLLWVDTVEILWCVILATSANQKNDESKKIEGEKQ